MRMDKKAILPIAGATMAAGGPSRPWARLWSTSTARSKCEERPAGLPGGAFHMVKRMASASGLAGSSKRISRFLSMA